jgi:MFS family permease
MTSALGRALGTVSMVTASSCLAMLAVGANGTAIMAALPSIQHDLGLDAGQVGWAVNVYLIASAACVMLGGRAADWAGPGRMAVLGLAAFAAASALIALAGSPTWLLAGRLLQGLGAAFAVPGTLAALGVATPPEGRAAAIGAWTGFLLLGFSLGPLLGGALTHLVGWRALFWGVAALLLIAAGGLAWARVPQPAAAGVVRRFDGAGFLLLAAAMVSAILALHALPRAAGDPLAFVAPLAVAAGALALLAYAERRAGDPFVPLALFGSPAFVSAIVVSAVPIACLLPLLLYFNLDAQSAQGLALTPAEAGLALLPMSAGLLTVALAAPRLLARFGPGVITGAMLLIAAASGLAAAAAAERVIVFLLSSLFLIGIGLALPYATGPRLALQAMPAGQGGQGAGLINACTFLGGSLGVTAAGIANALGGLSSVMALLGFLGLAGVVASRHAARVAPG